MQGRNYTKLFSIVGLILGEIYTLYTVLAPHHKGPPGKIRLPLPPEDPIPPEMLVQSGLSLFNTIMVTGVFMGICGALVGLGIGLLVTGLLAKPRPPIA